MDNLSPEERTRIYQEEKVRLEARDQVRREKKRSGCRDGCLVLVAIIGILFLIGVIGSVGNKTDPVDTRTYDEKLRATCKMARMEYGSSKISDLTIDQINRLRTCDALGY